MQPSREHEAALRAIYELQQSGFWPDYFSIQVSIDTGRWTVEGAGGQVRHAAFIPEINMFHWEDGTRDPMNYPPVERRSPFYEGNGDGI